MLYLDIQNACNYQAEQPDIILPETTAAGERIITTGPDGVEGYGVRWRTETDGGDVEIEVILTAP